MSKETEKTVELLLLYLRVRLASGDIAGAQVVADEIARELRNKGEISWDNKQEYVEIIRK